MPSCEICNASVAELRRGRCWGCYAQWVAARPVGFGAKCLLCGERRRRLLRSVELFGGWPAMCFSCNGLVGAMTDVPQTVNELRQAVARERRNNDRRSGLPDLRATPRERRVGERRAGASESYQPVDDDMIIEVTLDPMDLSFEDSTLIRKLPPGMVAQLLGARAAR